MVRPLIPIVTDWYAHEFDEIGHMTRVHAIYGSHHLQMELGVSKQESEQDKSSNTKSEDQVSFHFSPEQISNVHDVSIHCKEFLQFKLSLFPLVTISPRYQPPRFS